MAEDHCPVPSSADHTRVSWKNLGCLTFLSFDSPTHFSPLRVLFFPFWQTVGSFALQGTFGNVWRHLWWSQLWGVCNTGICWMEACILLNILQCTWQYPQTKTYPAPNVNSTKVEKPCTKLTVPKLQVLGWTYRVLWDISNVGWTHRDIHQMLCELLAERS